jgi:uncharacterized protein
VPLTVTVGSDVEPENATEVMVDPAAPAAAVVADPAVLDELADPDVAVVAAAVPDELELELDVLVELPHDATRSADSTTPAKHAAMRRMPAHYCPASVPAREVGMELTAVPIERPDELNVIIGQAHFIKTVEDIHEALAGSSPQLRFGVAFCEASGPCLVRRSGNDGDLVELAVRNAEAIGAGHVFVVLLRDGFPVNVLNAIKLVPEVCTIFCATANPLEVVVAETEFGRGVVGIIDGLPPAGVESAEDEADRKSLLRRIGYKL